jgi:Helix-turn-helix domain
VSVPTQAAPRTHEVLPGASDRLRLAPGLPERGIVFPRRRGRPRRNGDSPVTSASEVCAAPQQEQRALASSAIVPRLLTVEQAAVYLGLGDDTVRELVASGHLRRVRMPAPVTAKRAGSEIRRILLDRLDLDAQITAWREQR